MELLRPNLSDNETLTYEEKMEVLSRYLGQASLELCNAHVEYNWAINERIQLRAKELGHEA
jgi:hypothetical protein